MEKVWCWKILEMLERFNDPRNLLVGVENGGGGARDVACRRFHDGGSSRN